MGTSWRPSWWKEETHGTAWDRVKEVIRRDWEQNKKGASTGGSDPRQDTLRHAGQTQGNNKVTDWNDAEIAYGYGHGARKQYGAQFTNWTTELEGKLRTEWSAGRPTPTHQWDDVKQFVRRGFEFNDGSPQGSPNRENPRH